MRRCVYSRKTPLPATLFQRTRACAACSMYRRGWRRLHGRNDDIHVAHLEPLLQRLPVRARAPVRDQRGRGRAAAQQPQARCRRAARLPYTPHQTHVRPPVSRRQLAQWLAAWLPRMRGAPAQRHELRGVQGIKRSRVHCSPGTTSPDGGIGRLPFKLLLVVSRGCSAAAPCRPAWLTCRPCPRNMASGQP